MTTPEFKDRIARVIAMANANEDGCCSTWETIRLAVRAVHALTGRGYTAWLRPKNPKVAFIEVGTRKKRADGARHVSFLGGHVDGSRMIVSGCSRNEVLIPIDNHSQPFSFTGGPPGMPDEPIVPMFAVAVYRPTGKLDSEGYEVFMFIGRRKQC